MLLLVILLSLLFAPVQDVPADPPHSTTTTLAPVLGQPIISVPDGEGGGDVWTWDEAGELLYVGKE